MKRMITLLLCVAIFIATLTIPAIAEEKPFTIGFCNYANSSPFPYKIWQNMIKFCDEKGWALEATESLGDAETFMKCLDSYFLKEVDVIVAYWVDTAIAQNAKALCDEEGIPFILMGCEPENQLVVSADNVEFGRMVGTKLGEAALEKWEEPIDSILAVESPRNGELNTIRMSNAVQAILDTVGLTEDDIDIVYVDGEMDQSKAQQKTTDAFSAHPYWERTVVVAFEEEFTFAGALNAIVSENLGDQVVLAEVQGYTELLYNAIRDYDWVIGGGEHFAASFVTVIIDLCQQIKDGTVPEAGIYTVPLTFLDRSNYQEYSFLD